MTVDQAMLDMKRHEGSSAFSDMIKMLEAARLDAMEQMLDESGERLLELKGLAHGLRALTDDMLRKLPEQHPDH